MHICLDFDGVLHDTSTVPKGRRLGRPIDGARQACWDLLHAGHRLYVHTSRQHSEPSTDPHAFRAPTDWLEQWLRFWDFPYMTISALKPRCDLYVDDKGLAFKGWGNATDWPEGTWTH